MTFSKSLAVAAVAAAAVSTAPFAFAAPGDYHYESFARTWSDADEYCRNTYGGHLASIDNSADNALFDVLQPGDQWVWFGLNDICEEGVYVNADLTPVSYANWNPGEPNNSGNEDCVHMWHGRYWNDLPCHASLAFVCEEGDGSPVYPYSCDPDTDGDGVPDSFDACPGHDDNADEDNDGIPDGCDDCPDPDGDGFCNTCEVIKHIPSINAWARVCEPLSEDCSDAILVTTNGAGETVHYIEVPDASIDGAAC